MGNDHVHQSEREPRVMKSLDDKPLSDTAIDAIQESEGVKFVRGVSFFFGEMAGEHDEVTEDVVISTESSTKVLSRQAGTGWVIELEEKHEPEDDPEEVGEKTWMMASQMLSEGVEEMLGALEE